MRTVHVTLEHFNRLCARAAGNDFVVGALEIRARCSERDRRSQRNQLLARAVLHPAGSVVDVDEQHGGAVDQIDGVGTGVHCRAPAPQLCGARLHLLFQHQTMVLQKIC